MRPAPLFLYGTLLDPRTLARQSGRRALARGLRPAILPGWRRVRLRGTPYPTLVPDRAAETQGALAQPDAAALRRLAAYEGAEYRLLPVRVRCPNGPCAARAWIAPRWRADPGSPWPPADTVRRRPGPGDPLPRRAAAAGSPG